MFKLSDSITSGGGIGLKLSPPQSPVFKSPRKLNSMHAASDGAGEETSDRRSKRKRKAVYSFSPDSKKFWSKDEELAILKGIVEYRKSTGVDYHSDSRAFFDYIKDDINRKASRDQLMDKIRHLKKKFRNNLAKKPCFTNSHDSEAFDLSMAIWGNDEDECVDGNMDKAKGTKGKVRAFVEQEAVTNDEPENEDGSAKADSCDDKFPYENVEKRIEKEAIDKDSEDDELCALQDALETTMFQHLGNHAQKMMIQNLRTLGATERKELSDEWKALLVEEMILKGKIHSFAAKLANEAIASSGRTGN